MTSKIAFDEAHCDRSRFCPAARGRPTGAMHVGGLTSAPSFDSSKCTGCGNCLSSCPHGAVRVL